MKINSYRPFIVISAHQEGVSDTANYITHQELKLAVAGSFVEGIGVTEQWGVERVLILFEEATPDNEGLAASIVALLQKYNQEAILHVDQFRNCKLVHRTDPNMYIGVWTEVSQPEAEAQDHTMVLGKYFKDGKDKYYACK